MPHRRARQPSPRLRRPPLRRPEPPGQRHLRRPRHPRRAPFDAIVTEVANDESSAGLGGLAVWLRAVGGPLSGFQAYLAHHSRNIAVVGQSVKAGRVIGYVGATGNASFDAPHVHFQLHPGGEPPVDPYPSTEPACRGECHHPIDVIERMTRGTGRVLELFSRLIGSPKLLQLVLIGVVLLVYKRNTRADEVRQHHRDPATVLGLFTVRCGGGGAALPPPPLIGWWLVATGLAWVAVLAALDLVAIRVTAEPLWARLPGAERRHQ